MGSRYGGLKQMDPVGPNGEALLDYSVFDAKRAGFGKVVFIIRRDFEEMFREQVASRFIGHIEVDFAFQSLDDLPEVPGATIAADRSKPWGTAHATLAARHVVREPFCVINADDYYGRESYEIMHRFLTSPTVNECRTSMCGFVLENTLSAHGTVARGLCQVQEQSEHHYLTSVRELTKLSSRSDGQVQNVTAEGEVTDLLTGQEFVSMNMWGFPPSIFAGFESVFANFLRQHGADPKSEFYIPVALDALLQSGQERCEVLPTAGQWFGVTYRDDRPTVVEALTQLHQTGVYPDSLWG
jgi:hypothetical protein